MPPPESRPLLIPQNRKLRHLRGIYLQNLSFIRPRGHTIDDTALNKTPSKLESLRDTPQLQHALSSDNLRPKAPRRRSTALAQATPITRQRMLQLTIDGRAADVFFSLHCEDEDEPVYISEMQEHATVCHIPIHVSRSWTNKATNRTSTFNSSTSTTTAPLSLAPR